MIRMLICCDSNKILGMYNILYDIPIPIYILIKYIVYV